MAMLLHMGYLGDDQVGWWLVLGDLLYVFVWMYCICILLFSVRALLKRRPCNYTAVYLVPTLPNKAHSCFSFVLQPFHPMVNLVCSPDVRMFLCALYAPVCTEYGRVSLPCRALCRRAKDDCYSLMEMFGVTWPDEIECNR